MGSFHQNGVPLANLVHIHSDGQKVVFTKQFGMMELYREVACCVMISGKISVLFAWGRRG